MVQGISKNKAKEISQEYREKREFFNILEYLKKYNLSIENVTQIYNEYGINTVEIIKNNFLASQFNWLAFLYIFLS